MNKLIDLCVEKSLLGIEDPYDFNDPKVRQGIFETVPVDPSLFKDQDELIEEAEMSLLESLHPEFMNWFKEVMLK